MMKSSLCIMPLAGLLVAGCVNVTSWTTTPITMSDGFVTELRIRTITQGNSQPAETAFIVMPDGDLIQCFGNCITAYEQNKAAHQPGKKTEAERPQVEGD